MGFQFFCAQLTEPKQYLVLDVEFDWFWTCERFSTIILRLYCRHSIITLVGSCSQNSHVSIDWGSHFRLTLLAAPTDSDMCFLEVSSCFLSENEHDCFVSTNFGFCADARFSGKQRIATCARVLLALFVHNITSAHPRSKYRHANDTRWWSRSRPPSKRLLFAFIVFRIQWRISAWHAPSLPGLPHRPRQQHRRALQEQTELKWSSDCVSSLQVYLWRLDSPAVDASIQAEGGRKVRTWSHQPERA